MADDTLELRPNIDLADPGADEGTWGQITNEALDQLSHEAAFRGPLSEIEAGGSLEPGLPELQGGELFIAENQSPPSLHLYEAGTEIWKTIYDGQSTGVSGNIAPTGLSVTEWNVIDVANEGYDGTRSGDLTTLINNNPNSLFVLRPGGNYEMSTYQNANYDFFGLICPTAGNRPRIYPRQASRTGTKGGGSVTAQQVEFLDLGGHGGTDRGGHTHVENVVFANEPGKTNADGWRYDCGFLKGVFHDEARFINVKYENPRHKNEPDGSGGYYEHGSRYQIRAEGAQDSANVVFDGLRMPDGGTEESAVGSATDHAIGFAVEEHYGSLTIERSYLKGWVDNGLYTTQTIAPIDDAGKITIENCHIENCSNSNIRLGPNQKVINCRIDLLNTNNNIYQGIALHLQDPYNSRVDGLHIKVTNHSNDVVRVNSATNFVKLSGVEITNDTSNRVCEISGPADQANGRVVLDHWKVQDSGGDGSFNSFMEFTGNRDDIIIQNSRLHTSTRGCIRARGGVKVKNCNFYTGTNYPALRIGAYNTSTDPGQDSVVTFHDNKVANGNAFGLEPYAVVGTLDIQRNDFNPASSVFGAPSAPFSGDIVNFVCKNNDGYQDGEAPPDAWVRGRLDTDAPIPVRERPTPFAHSFHGDMVYDKAIDDPIRNVSWAWKYVRTNTLAGTIEDGEYGDLNAWTTNTNASISSAQVHNSNNSVLFDGLNSVSGHNVSQLGDGLNHYPRKGDKFRLFFYITSKDTIQFYFAAQSVGNGSESFSFTVDTGTDDIVLQEKGNSGSATLIDQPITGGWVLNQWYQLICEWRDDGSDTIYAEVLDDSGTTLASDTGTLTIYPGRREGGVGTFIGGAARVFVDDWRIIT